MVKFLNVFKRFFVITLILSLFAVAAVATGTSIILYNQLIQVSNELNSEATKPPENTSNNMVSTKVYFSKNPESYSSDFTYVVGVDRQIDKTKPVETVITKLLAGPSNDESILGYKNPIVLSGVSNCNGDDFKIITNLTPLGTDVEVQFCKDINIAGAGDVARVQAVVSKTVLGLETTANYNVGKIAVLDKAGNCLGDASGMNACLM